jgi:transcriptional regulatory protein LevR
MAAKLGDAIVKALDMPQEVKLREVEAALTRKFPTDEMMEK